MEWAEVADHIVGHCVELHSGYWFMNECRVAWRPPPAARVTEIWVGAIEVMKQLVGGN